MRSLFDILWEAFRVPPEITSLIISFAPVCDKCGSGDTVTPRNSNERCKNCQRKQHDRCAKCSGKKMSFWCDECKPIACSECDKLRVRSWCSRCHNRRCSICRKKRSLCICNKASDKCVGCRFHETVPYKYAEYAICVRFGHESEERIVVRLKEKFHNDLCAKRFARRYILKNLDTLVELKHQVCGGYTSSRMYLRKM